MKKKMILVFLVLSLTAALMGCGQKETEKTTETEETTQQTTQEVSNPATTDSDRTKLIVGFDAEYPPYGYMNDAGEYVGFDLDCAQEVCDRLGWELVKTPINWDSKDMELNSGTIDCIWNGFSITQDRLDDYAWSDPYVDNSQVIVVKADSDITSLTDLAGKNVVVQASSAALEALNSEEQKTLRDSFADLSEVPDYNTAFMNMDSGAADAVAIDIGVAKYQIASRDAGKYTILPEAVLEEQYGIGFRVGDTALRDQVQEVLYEMVKDGTYASLAEQYDLADSICLGK